MDLVVAGVVGQPHLANTFDTEGIDEAIDPFGHQVRVVGRERPAQLFGRNRIEILAGLFDRVGQVVNFGLFGFEVQVFEENSLSGVGSVLANADQPVERGLFALCNIAGKVNQARISREPTWRACVERAR